MTLNVQKVALEAILSLRTLFLQEANHQVRHNAVHERGWSGNYASRACLSRAGLRESGFMLIGEVRA